MEGPMRRVLVATLGFAVAALASVSASAVNIEWVSVGAPGNAADPSHTACGPSRTSPCGAVPYSYQISKYEVTYTQYAEFLNAVAKTDANALYEPLMETLPTFGGIARSGSPGSYSYAVRAGFESKPAAFVSFWDAARFSNWLQNGQPSTGTQTSLTTEDGAYTLTQESMFSNSVTRNPGATFFVPSESEWYKAAYYDPVGNQYFDYPTRTNVQTACSAPAADSGSSANCYPNAFPPGSLTDVGAYRLSVGPNGTFDQGGNVFEWTEQIRPFATRALRGGAWAYSPSFLGANASYDGGVTADTEYLGFRVASIPEPSTGLLVSTGFLALAGVRRRRA
jgi:formylglycine-generating enzyme required for sulfatase activity